MNTRLHVAALAVVLALFTPTLRAQVPQLINYQGRVAVGTTNFDGSGSFKFALVNTDGSVTYWSNDGTGTAGSQPTAAVALTVTKGLYSVLLGDTTITNMTAIPASVFTHTDVRLRVWFNNGTNGFQILTPDQRIAAVGYAMMAGNVPDGTITSAKIAPGAVGSTQIASGAIGSTDVSFTRSGTGMAARTLGAEIAETPITSKGAGAAVNGSTDDTASIQRALDTKGHVVLSSGGATKLTDYLTLSTIGQVIEGTGVSNGTQGSLLMQTTAGKDGLRWFTTSDVLPLGGGGLYFASLRDFSLLTTHPNTGIGLNIGNDATHSGDYFRASNIHLMGGWQTGVHLQSMANTLLEGVYFHGDLGTPSDYGFLLEGGSDNSHLLLGVSADHATTGLRIAGPGTFNIFPWDFGSNATHMNFAAGANTIVFGGNLGEGYTTRAIHLETDSSTVLLQPLLSKSGFETNEPILVDDGANLVYIGVTGTLGDGSVGTSGAKLFKGSGFVSLTSTNGVDTVGSIHAETFHQTVFKSVFDDGLLTAGAANRGAINQVVGRSTVSEDGISFSKRLGDGSYILDYLDNSKLLRQANTWTAAQTIGADSYLQLPSASGGRGGALLWDSVTGWGASRRWWVKTNTGSGGELVFRRSANATTDPSEDIFGADQAGTLQAYKGLTVTGLTHLVPRTAPGSPAEGDIYADSGDHHLYFFNGSAWKQLDN